MKDASLKNHLTIVGQLPDFVLGKLDETSLRRVSRHLEDCPTCQREVTNALVVLGLLGSVPPPSASSRSAILSRAAALRPVTVGPQTMTGTESGTSTRNVRLEQFSGSGPRLWGPWRQLFASRAVAAAAMVLISGLLGWSYEQQHSGIQQEQMPPAIDEQVTAYPLDDSDLSATAAGVVFAEPGSREVYLVANGLPVLPHNQRYQVWLFTADNKQESAGLLAVDANGELRAYLQTPQPFADYVGVALTAEPLSGSAVPTSDLILGGSFPPAIAALQSSQA